MYTLGKSSSSNPSKVRSYSLPAMIQAKPGTVISTLRETKQEFRVNSENSFIVLDGKRVVGRDESKKKLVLEDITRNKPSLIAEHGDYIQTLLYDPKTETLLVGDSTKHVIQYEREESGSFTLLKDFGDVGVGLVTASAKIGGFGVFGGLKTSRMVAIDLKEGRLCQGTIITAFEDVFSLQECKVSGSETLLSVGGTKPSYSGSLTNVFRVKIESSKLKETVSKEAVYDIQTPPRKEFILEEKTDTLMWGLRIYVEQLFQNYSQKYSVDRLKCKFWDSLFVYFKQNNPKSKTIRSLNLT